jgi:cell division protein FtsW
VAVASTRLSDRPITSHASREAARDRLPGRVVQGPQRERHEPDYLLLLAAVALSAIGILMVYSSGGVEAASTEGGSIFDAVTTQLGWGLLGAVVLVAVMRIDYRSWRRFSVLGMAVAIILLVLVLMPAIPPLTEPVSNFGATRWLRLGGLPTFHPAELAKLALVVFMAHWLTTRGREVSSVRKGLLPFVIVVGLVAGLVVMEPDLGTTGVLVLTAFTMFFVAGGSIMQLLLIVPLGIAAVAAVLVINPYQMARWTTFLDPFADACEECFQTMQGLKALALGGLAGQGLGQSRQPSGLQLPAAENDFIFAVLGQELGLIGGITVIGLFLLLTWRGMRVAMRAPDTFGGLLALGVTSWLAFQAFINIGVVVVMLPLTGMPLPFLSDGGSSLVVALAAVGILLSISRESTPQGVRGVTNEDPHRGRRHRRPHLPRLGRGLAADRPTA